MNYCLIGPTKSGKSTLALHIAQNLKLTIVDTGQMVRLTADDNELKELAEGKLSNRGVHGQNWINGMVDKAINQYPNGVLFVGYPRNIDQYLHIKDREDFKIVVHLASKSIRSSRCRNRPDDNDVSLKEKDNTFYGLLNQIHDKVDLFLTTDMTDGSVVHAIREMVDPSAHGFTASIS